MNCIKCSNESVCLACDEPYSFKDGQCISCPTWPL